MMDKLQIATILDDGTYGQREMTDEEYEAYQEVIAGVQQNAPAPDSPSDPA